MAPAITRDFDAERADRPAEGPTFKLGGQWWHCVPVLPFPTLQNLADSAGSTDVKSSVLAIGALFDNVLVDDDVDGWHTLLADKVRCPSLVELSDITQWVVTVYVARPTLPPSDSPAGPESGATSSTGDSSLSDVPTEPAA